MPTVKLLRTTCRVSVSGSLQTVKSGSVSAASHTDMCKNILKINPILSIHNTQTKRITGTFLIFKSRGDFFNVFFLKKSRFYLNMTSQYASRFKWKWKGPDLRPGPGYGSGLTQINTIKTSSKDILWMYADIIEERRRGERGRCR